MPACARMLAASRNVRHPPSESGGGKYSAAKAEEIKRKPTIPSRAERVWKSTPELNRTLPDAQLCFLTHKLYLNSPHCPDRVRRVAIIKVITNDLKGVTYAGNNSHHSDRALAAGNGKFLHHRRVHPCIAGGGDRHVAHPHH